MLHPRSWKLLATLIIISVLVSSAPPITSPVQAMPQPASAAAFGPAAPLAAPAPRVLNTVPVDSPSAPHNTPPPPSLQANAPIDAVADLASSDVELLLPPFGASGANDRIWHYHHGAWTSIAPPPATAGWYWYSIVANPFDRDEWLLFGNAQLGDTYDVDAQPRIFAQGTTRSPLWRTSDAGAHWTPIELVGLPRSGHPFIKANFPESGNIVEFDTTTDGAFRIAGALLYFDNEFKSEGAFWRGTTGATNVSAAFVSTDWNDTDSQAVPGVAGDLVVSDYTSGRLGYVSATGISITQSGSSSTNRRPKIERLPGSSTAVVGIDTGIFNIGSFDVWATPNYRTTAPTQRLSGQIGSTITAAAHGVYIGGRLGVLKVDNILSSTPVTTTVTDSNARVVVVRADRQTRQFVAALRDDKTAFYVTTDGATWQTIATTPGITTHSGNLSLQFEVIAPKKALLNSQSWTSGSCQ